MKKAFTLAEVLITLGIIGVVAALVMPAVLNNTKGKQFRAGFKKSASAINQAVTRSVALNDFNFGDLRNDNIDDFFKTNLKTLKVGYGSTGYDINANGVTGFSNSATNYTVFLSDGSVLQLSSQVANGCTAANPCDGFIDVNGKKGPNKVAICTSGADDTCAVDTPTDVYPVSLFDMKLIAGSDAAWVVLYDVTPPAPDAQPDNPCPHPEYMTYNSSTGLCCPPPPGCCSRPLPGGGLEPCGP